MSYTNLAMQLYVTFVHSSGSNNLKSLCELKKFYKEYCAITICARLENCYILILYRILLYTVQYLNVSEQHHTSNIILFTAATGL